MLDKPDGGARPKAAQQIASTTVAPPCAMVIFGAAGDLTKRLVVPALYNLANDHQLSEEFRLVGVDLTEMSPEQWRAHLTDAMKGYVGHDGEFHLDEFAQATWQWLTERMSYLPGDLNNPETYRRLGEHLAGLDRAAGRCGGKRAFHQPRRSGFRGG
jgi:glucose-6-phosphate 1-dehydrogenase